MIERDKEIVRGIQEEEEEDEEEGRKLVDGSETKRITIGMR